jgi:hypothetical protein
MNAIRIIHSEHRSLAAVLHGMLHLVREIGLRNSTPNFELFGAIVYYIDVFAERLHHPKEDEYLFKSLRLRSADAAALVDRLKQSIARVRRRSSRSSRRCAAMRKAGPGSSLPLRNRSAPTRRSTGNTCARKKIGSCRSPARISRTAIGDRSTTRSPETAIRCSASTQLRNTTRSSGGSCAWHPRRSAWVRTRCNVAERQGFEPWIPCGIRDFESRAFDHSAISPQARIIT